MIIRKTKKLFIGYSGPNYELCQDRVSRHFYLNALNGEAYDLLGHSAFWVSLGVNVRDAMWALLVAEGKFSANQASKQ